MSDDQQEIWDAFKEAVNMTASELENWLDTDGPRRSARRRTGANRRAIGRTSDRRHPAEDEADLTDDDYAHMRKVVAYVKRPPPRPIRHHGPTRRYSR